MSFKQRIGAWMIRKGYKWAGEIPADVRVNDNSRIAFNERLHLAGQHFRDALRECRGEFIGDDGNQKIEVRTGQHEDIPTDMLDVNIGEGDKI